MDRDHASDDDTIQITAFTAHEEAGYPSTLSVPYTATMPLHEESLRIGERKGPLSFNVLDDMVRAMLV